MVALSLVNYALELTSIAIPWTDPPATLTRFRSTLLTAAPCYRSWDAQAALGTHYRFGGRRQRPNSYPTAFLSTPPACSTLDSANTTADMSADLVSILLQFQPEAPEVKLWRDYDQAARNFAAQLSNISSSHWQKAAGTPQDVLTVCLMHCCPALLLTPLGSQPFCQLNSVRLRAPPSHRHLCRQAHRSRGTQARRLVMD